jgi:hypothetical protein
MGSGGVDKEVGGALVVHDAADGEERAFEAGADGGGDVEGGEGFSAAAFEVEAALIAVVRFPVGGAEGLAKLVVGLVWRAVFSWGRGEE